VGTRGETPECFDETYQFLRSLDVSQLHVFPYSERPGTAALRIPYVVEESAKKERSRLLIELSEAKRQSFYSKYEGQEAEVLLEKATHGRQMHGFTRNYIRAELPAALSTSELDNKIVRVKLGAFNHDKSALKIEHLYE